MNDPLRLLQFLNRNLVDLLFRLDGFSVQKPERIEDFGGAPVQPGQSLGKGLGTGAGITGFFSQQVRSVCRFLQLFHRTGDVGKQRHKDFAQLFIQADSARAGWNSDRPGQIVAASSTWYSNCPFSGSGESTDITACEKFRG